MKTFKDSLRRNIPYLQQQKLNQLLFRALQDPNAEVISRGKTHTLEELLEAGAEVDSLNSSNETPLMWIAKHPYKDEEFKKLKTLIHQGAKINFFNKDGDTALTIAAANGHEEVVKTLIENGADFNAVDQDGMTPLMHAAHKGKTERVRMLADRSETNIHAVDDNGSTALTHAIRRGKEDGYSALKQAIRSGETENIETLIQKGADIHALDNSSKKAWNAIGRFRYKLPEYLLSKYPNLPESTDSRTPLTRAAEFGNEQALAAVINNSDKRGNIYHDYELSEALFCSIKAGNTNNINTLIKKGANVNRSNHSVTPLIHAIKHGDLAVVTLLFDNGANVNAVDKDSWSDPLHLTPLMQAINKDNLAIASFLVKNGAGVNAIDKNNNTPLIHAVGRNNFAMTDLLIRAGAEVKGSSASLRRSINENNLQITELLVKSGANVHGRDSEGLTLLIQAIQRGNFDITQVLVNNGANVNMADSRSYTDNLTPLMHAIKKDDLAVVTLLVNNRANVNAKDKEDLTPLMHAIKQGDLTITTLLVNNGANVNAKDKEGLTPLMHAIKQGDFDAAQVLIDNGANIHDVVGKKGLTPLMHAVEARNFAITDLLIRSGAEVNNKNNDAFLFSYFSSVDYKNPKITDLLIQNGANIHAVDEKGFTPLMHAILNKSKNNIEDLESRGADSGAVDNDGYTAWEYYYEYGLRRKRDYFYREPHTALTRAAEFGNEQALATVINSREKRHYSNTYDDQELSKALFYSIKAGNINNINTLTKKGAQLDAKVLMQVDESTRESVIQFMIEKGDINVVDKEGKTALIHAVTAGKTNDIKTLIEHGVGMDSNILNQSTDPKIRDVVIINAALNQCPIRSNWQEIQIGLSKAEKIQDAVSLQVAAFLAATLPEGDVQKKMFNKLDDSQKKEVSNFINLKEKPDVNCLPEIQQNKLAAFKLGLDSGRNNATYLAALLPAGDLQKEIIQEYNDKNPKDEDQLNQEKINALRCFAYGVGKTKGFTTEDGKIDYPRAGEVVKELINSKNVLNDLTMMLGSRLEMETNFHAAIEKAKKENSEVPEIPKKDWVVFDSFLSQKIQSYCHKKDSIFNNPAALKIFGAYMAEHDAQQKNNDLPTPPNTTTEHPMSQTLKKIQPIGRLKRSEIETINR